MKLRRFELRTPRPDLPYDQILKEITLSPLPGTTGISNAELADAVAIQGKIREAKEKGQKEILLTQADYDYIMKHLEPFRWGFRDVDMAPVALEFLAYVRGLKEEDFDITPAKSA
jgi:hypothetical protein